MNRSATEKPGRHFSQDEATPGLDVIIPVYNESGEVVRQTVDGVKFSLAKRGSFRIIVVDDGSSAPCLLQCPDPLVTVVRHEKNRGYGRALKTGIENGSAPLIAIIDADGSYPAGDMARLAELMNVSDMVVGTRNGPVVEEFPLRVFLKRGLNLAASILTGSPITDLNSGMRVFSRELCLRFWDHYPEGFSFTSTITMGAVFGGFRVTNVPINYYRRVGQSSVRLLRDSFLMAVKLIRLTYVFRFRKNPRRNAPLS
ncbi:MAG: glycosyltransferase family 2 protein [Deltaproteobacteria bacterium]|nr:glycosyltransferase family 2 protein [Deltaproteobacteria bacterium]